MRYVLGFLSFLIAHNALAEGCQKPCPSWWARGWAVTPYIARFTSQTTSKIPVNPDFSNSGLVALAGSKELGAVWENRLGFELESQVIQHFGGQDHFEVVPISLVLRWKSFPWNKYLPTTFAFGDGISITSKMPKLEVQRRKLKNCSRTLNTLMGEITLSLPECPNWALVIRYHHRSGIFGIYNGAHDASSAFGGGFKYWF